MQQIKNLCTHVMFSKFSLYASVIAKNGKQIKQCFHFDAVQDLNNFIVTYGDMLASDWMIVQHFCRLTDREKILTPKKETYYEEDLPF